MIKRIRGICIALFSALSFAIVGALPVNAADKFVSVEFDTAKLTGKPNCASKYPGTKSLDPAFLHAWNKTCWSCPKSYSRTADPKVDGNKACRLPGKTYFKKAKKHRKNTKIGQGCPAKQFWDIKGGEKGLGACYSCANSYAQSASSVTSAKACIRKQPGKYAKGKKRGTPGCAGGAFRNGLKNQCYTCPKGYKRSLAVGKDLAKNKHACFRAKVDVNALKNSKCVAWAKDEADVLMEEYGPMIAKALSELKKINQAKNRPNNQFITPAAVLAANRKLANGMINWTKNHQKKAALDVRYASTVAPTVLYVDKNKKIKTITLGWAIDASFGVGGTLNAQMGAWDISVAKKGGKPTMYAGLAWSVGITGGMDIAPELGFWVDANTALAGNAQGLIIGGAFKGGAALSLWFSYGKVKTGKHPRFLGFTMLPQLGLSGEFEYTRGWTEVFDLN